MYLGSIAGDTDSYFRLLLVQRIEYANNIAAPSHRTLLPIGTSEYSISNKAKSVQVYCRRTNFILSEMN
jgi:hypothetical protein